ncbi:MAG: type II secretion system F family protein, partial [Thermodesulfobacteriota bacterium]
MDLLIGIGTFVFVVLLIEGSYLIFRTLRSPEEKEIRRRLNALASLEYDSVDIVRKRVLSEVPWLNRKLLKWKWTGSVGLLLEQAGARHTLGFYILLSALLAFLGFTVGSWLSFNYLLSLIIGACLACLPIFQILTKKRKRMEKFHSQLPEALDLIARALRAGQALSGTLKMVADEMDDPIGDEFDKTLNEINFGVGVSEALKNLATRVDCLDLKFFVIAVVIQRETGGNLADILENSARIIRERFKLHGRIRVLAAE